MKASDYMSVCKANGMDDAMAKKMCKAMIAKGEMENDLGDEYGEEDTEKGAASALLGKLVEAGLSDDHARETVREAIAKGSVSDDLNLHDGQDAIDAINAAADELEKGAQSDLEGELDNGDLFDEFGEFGDFGGLDDEVNDDTMLLAFSETADGIVKSAAGALRGVREATATGLRAQAEALAMFKGMVQRFADVEAKVDGIAKSLGTVVPPRALTGAKAQSHPGDTNAAANTDEIAKGVSRLHAISKDEKETRERRQIALGAIRKHSIGQNIVDDLKSLGLLG